jgi:hypothetical protein
MSKLLRYFIKKVDKVFGGFIVKIYDLFRSPNIISLYKNNVRKIIIFSNSSNNLLSRLSEKYNSDKGSTKLIKTAGSYGYEPHSYTDFYSMLFESNRENYKFIFECGILDGASLRMWKEYFINAVIFGADINKNLLFQEDRIRTLYVDQLQRNSIKKMWLDININYFDLIIDDGLHTDEANINLFIKTT